MLGPADNTELYKQDVLWDRAYPPEFYEKKRIFQGLIDPEVQRILDVGCGDGEITNDLAPGRHVVGLDRSETALQYVTTETVQAGCDDIPFPDGHFDLVLCSEVLEHLPPEIYRSALKEMRRVASRNIVISVPYRETLYVGMTKCAHCGMCYHLTGHLRRFRGPGDVEAEFPEFQRTFVGYCGERDGRRPGWFLRARRKILGDWPNKGIALCPRCGSKDVLGGSGEHSFKQWVLDRIEWRLKSTPVHRWMVLKLKRGDK